VYEEIDKEPRRLPDENERYKEFIERAFFLLAREIRDEI
jgi:hypothetical protein